MLSITVMSDFEQNGKKIWKYVNDLYRRILLVTVPHLTVVYVRGYAVHEPWSTSTNGHLVARSKYVYLQPFNR